MPSESQPSPKRSQAVWVEIVLMLLLALLLSVGPAVLGLAADKSGLGLGILCAWYALFPPLLLFGLGLVLYRREKNRLRLWGRVWLGVGLWFAVQAFAAALAPKSLVLELLALPAILAGGGWSFIVGAALFLGGGTVLLGVGGRAAGERSAAPRSGRGSRAVARTAARAAFAAALVAIPVFVLLSSAPGAVFVPASGAVSVPSSGPAAAAPSQPAPSADEIWGYIKDIYSFGPRRTGSAAYLAASDYLVSQLKAFGFSDVRIESLKFDYWDATRWRLSVDDGTGSRDLECYFVPYSGPTGPEGVTGDIVYVGRGRPEDWAGKDLAGKVALVDLDPITVGWDQLKVFSYLAYDPARTAEGQARPYPIGWMMNYLDVYPALAKAGVSGIIGVLRGYPDLGPLSYYAPYDGTLRSVPSLYIREQDGDRLEQVLRSGRVTARLVLEATVSRGGGEARVVYGVLPGRSRTNIIVHSHFDSPWASGVEDSSGTGMVLALARYYAGLPVEARARTMVFLFTGSHMIGGPTNQAFIENHRGDIMASNLLDIAIEHIADDYPYTAMATSRGAFVTEDPVLASLFARAVSTEGLVRTLVFPTGTPLGVPTDAGPFHEAGYRVASLISGPVYLFDQADTLDRVVKADLAPMARTYIDFISRLNRVPDWMVGLGLGALAPAVLLVLSALGWVAFGPGREDTAEQARRAARARAAEPGDR